MLNIPEKYSWLDLSDPIYYSALEQLVNGTDNLNIIGSGGSGKSVLLTLAYDMLQAKGYQIAVVTPTGISSFNLNCKKIPSVTIHSFFKLPPSNVYTSSMYHINPQLYELMNTIDILFIDEISFCSNSLFDAIHELLLLYRSKKEKNLCRIITFGDPLQLEVPIDRKNKDILKYYHELYDDNFCYFNSYAFKDYNYKTIVLKKIYRIKDILYQGIFNRVREGLQTKEDLNILNQQVQTEEQYFLNNEIYLYLSTTNAGADLVNNSYYEINTNKPHLYKTHFSGKVDLSKRKNIHEEVYLKKDAQIMCLFNSPSGDYVNGTLGKVKFCNADSVVAEKESGEEFIVQRHIIDDYNYEYDSENKQIKLSVCGSLNTIGCCLAYSITFHKTQSLSLNHYYIDLGKNMFCNAQLYTAISRSTFFPNVGMSRPITHKDILTSKEALQFLSKI